jgi:outer membrane PBP1 activator LpoA protein
MLPPSLRTVQAIRSLNYTFLLAALLSLAACTTGGPVVVTDDTQLERRAAALEAAGDIQQAVAVHATLFERASASERSRHAIAAARLLIDGGALEAARPWLSRAQENADAGQQQWIRVLSAELALFGNDPAAALEHLSGAETSTDQSLSLRAMAAQGRALFRLGRVEDAVRILVERDLWLDSDTEILANHELIWNGLRNQLSARPVVASGDPTVDGWLGLFPVAVAMRSNPFTVAEGLTEWMAAYPRHPASRFLLPQLLEEDRVARAYPQQIAVLLPLSRIPEAAAIRDGFIAAYLSNPSGSDTRLKIYDTDQLGSHEAYLQAQVDGADFIVGPLLKPDVETVVPISGIVPTLALNNLQSNLPPPENFYQFALAPEDEAAEVARHAIAAGARNAVALIPNDDWGLRLLQSFQAELEALGGSLLQFRAYDTGTRDFSLAITTLLNLSFSTQRYQRLAANLGVPIEFEPRRRQDVDMIFFAAQPRAGRLLAPQFRFHFAGDLPTYATSEVYDAVNQGADVDLNGVIFPETPWLLTPDDNARELMASLTSYWPQRTASARWLRLYGMGFDAYRLVPMLYNGGRVFISIPGMSGDLWMDDRGEIHRRLPIAQFQNGRPVALEAELPAPGAEAQILTAR